MSIKIQAKFDKLIWVLPDHVTQKQVEAFSKKVKLLFKNKKEKHIVMGGVRVFGISKGDMIEITAEFKEKDSILKRLKRLFKK